MSLALATALVLMLKTYAAVGLLFAIGFARWGAGRLDPVARDGSLALHAKQIAHRQPDRPEESNVEEFAT